MGLTTHNASYRIANFARPVKMKTNYCYVMDATKDTTHTVLNRRWSIYRMVIGEYGI